MLKKVKLQIRLLISVAVESQGTVSCFHNINIDLLFHPYAFVDPESPPEGPVWCYLNYKYSKEKNGYQVDVSWHRSNSTGTGMTIYPVNEFFVIIQR